MSAPAQAAVIEVAGDLRVAVPDTIELMTPYVLREQEGWFEEEWRFLPRLVQAGAKVVDIGANYGAYTLPLARAVGADGHLWAFEPATATAAYLTQSIELNGLANVTLQCSALSDHVGTANLFLSDNSELNSLNTAGGGAAEVVPLTTLDRCREKFGWDGVELVKLDAEGEEVKILDGGAAFFTAETPLVMFELKHKQEVHRDLIAAFGELGYDTYRLVVGLDLLVPFEAGEVPDPYQLNLFACKEDRAARLAAAGRLVAQADEVEGAVEPLEATSYRSLPFVKVLGRQWWGGKGSGDGATHRRAVELYLAAHAEGASPGHRYGSLRCAFELLRSLCAAGDDPARLSTFARVAWEVGQRGVATEALIRALQVIEQTGRVRLVEPFLPASPRLDRIDPAGRVAEWFVTGLLEQRERLWAYSSYFVGKPGLAALEQMKRLGFQSAEMERRRQLVRMRLGQQAGPEPSPLLAERREDNLNPGYWVG